MSEENQDQPRIAGVSFSLYPMCDNFADLILTAIKKVDSSKVWMKTDRVSTIVRGRIPHIFDVTQAAFLEIAKTGEHVVYSATFSVGCPGDTEGHAYMDSDDVLMNQDLIKSVEQDLSAKFALYPMGGGNYMDPIYEQIEAMKGHGVDVELTHYETMLDGPAQNIFKGLQSVLQAMEEAGSPHTVMTVTLSANSPSAK
ncbi:YkoF family thiamine/hydroxymethylpyrimidine-binding protein [Rhodohalobacter sp. 8-1]|uniref:YkoF family thiamine/hydroxymethylpyrimidine-binding protein n=1 Tax=Rhodohalobacter sp. 8-1 TaxID=3131972 RepID=UPI0030EF95A9